MGRYDALRDYLAGLPAQAAAEALGFEAIEGLVGALPPSARQFRAWWANSSNVQAAAWHDAGWHVDSVHLDAARVIFARGARGGTYAARRAAQRASAAAPAEGPGDARRPADPVADVGSAAAPRGSGDAPGPVAPADGFSEASVQAVLVTHLVRAGWQIRWTADTATRERGIDILAARGGRTLAVEVKGFPTRGTYADPRRVAEIKPTQPATQARHWFAHAVLKAMLTLDEFPDYEVAIGLPDVATYRRLYERTCLSLGRAAIGVLFVDEHGEVHAGAGAGGAGAGGAGAGGADHHADIATARG
ncbi:hypothetical protein CC117_25515 [Parafrankia colletiae]|uniref:DUF7662 domain-containing protein n=1 Tax=Parafrankia colletiae TaxID=573497 RepID=A0A1S1QA23_9ACTN|nr:hypothetical protein [Parafrankia colletiae]MCK9902150.1 hypothetical protein [Frankia sp. Cpl3]OHV31693.1 hypothetical protein CC117_25515 [Parafrankia colletiae]